jgi:hypothetical protein
MRQSDTRPWNSARATLYGALIGGVAAAFKLMAPWGEPHSAAAIAEELTGAALAFALLCGMAAALRNFVIRRLVETESQRPS